MTGFVETMETIESIAISRDERTVYTGSREGNLQSWDTDTCAQKTLLLHLLTEEDDHSSFQLGVLADENLVVGYYSDYYDSCPRVIKISTSILSHRGSLGSLPDEKESACETEFECPFTVSTVEKNGQLVAFSDDGMRFVTKDENAELNIWNGMNMMKIATIPTIDAFCTAIDKHAKHLATLTLNSIVTVYKEGEGEQEETYRTVGTCDIILSDAFSSGGIHLIGDGERLISCMGSGSICVSDLRKAFSEQRQERPKMTVVRTVAATPTGEIFVTGDQGGEIKLWETRTGDFSSAFPSTHKDCIISIGISENGEWLVSLSDDGMVALWHMETRNLNSSFQIQEYSTFGSRMDVGCDGRRLVLQTDDGKIQLWDTSSKARNCLSLLEPLLVIPEEKRTTGTSWHEVWLRKDSPRIVTVSNVSIEEWDTSSGSCVYSRKCTWFHLHYSREEILNLLDHSQGGDIDDSDRLFLHQYCIFYGRQNSYRKLGTLERWSFAHSYCSKSQSLCVSNAEGFKIFHLAL